MGISKKSDSRSKLPTVLLAAPSLKSKNTPLAHSADTLKQFQIPSRRVAVAGLKTTPPLKKTHPFGIIALNHPRVLAWVQKHYPDIPVLTVPGTSEGGERDLHKILEASERPAGEPYPSFAIGRSGEVNAALFMAALIALEHAAVRRKLLQFRKKQTDKILSDSVLV